MDRAGSDDSGGSTFPHGPIEAGDGIEIVDESLAGVAAGILAGAFYADPLWSWAFPDPARRHGQHRSLWRYAVEGAIRYPWTFLAAGRTAAAVWIPPGGTEQTDQDAARLEPLLTELLGAGATRALATLDLLDQARSHDVPHFYLSLLGTDPGHRGHGHGLGLLARSLRRIDAHGAAAYVESSNPANVPLYARHGFVTTATLTAPGRGPEITTMWRDPRPGSQNPGPGLQAD